MANTAQHRKMCMNGWTDLNVGDKTLDDKE
jgi:hypothetical protein